MTTTHSQETTEKEYEDALRRAFCRTPEPDYIFFDSRRQVFQAQAIAYGEKMGWLVGNLNQIETQYSRYEARLTPKGREFFNLL